MMEELYKNSNTIDRFNIRVYGIVTDSTNGILLCTEQYKGLKFTKFPGGGLEFGEGTAECLKREFKEELNAEIDILEHFYTTDFFQQSAFVKTDQLISIYYKVNLKEEIKNYKIKHQETTIDFLWKPLKELIESDVTFPIDKVVVRKLLNN